MTAPVFYRGSGFEVTDRLLKTPRRSYLLDRIEYVSVTRPLLIFLGSPAAGSLGIAFPFGRYLLWNEIAGLAAVSVAALFLGYVVATLRVHSPALRGDEDTQTFGPVWRLRQVRTAVERAMISRQHKELHP